jgi:hypothetical protein
MKPTKEDMRVTDDIWLVGNRLIGSEKEKKAKISDIIAAHVQAEVKKHLEMEERDYDEAKIKGFVDGYKGASPSDNPYPNKALGDMVKYLGWDIGRDHGGTARETVCAPLVEALKQVAEDFNGGKPPREYSVCEGHKALDPNASTIKGTTAVVVHKAIQNHNKRMEEK